MLGSYMFDLLSINSILKYLKECVQLSRFWTSKHYGVSSIHGGKVSNCASVDMHIKSHIFRLPGGTCISLSIVVSNDCMNQ